MGEVVTSLAHWRERIGALRSQGQRIGLVMTMGALHAGHASLLERAARECDVAAATIFVNPRQFNDPGDLAAYPSDLAADLAVCDAAGVSLVLAPDVAEVWPSTPEPTSTTVHVAGLAEVLEGADRPGHFDGVASVVAKLAIVTGDCVAYFGEKDFQQLCVVRRVVEDLGLPLDVVGCETVREPDGLAMSSRNARLSAAGRVAAPVLLRGLLAGRDALERGADVAGAEGAVRAAIAAERRVDLAYAAVVEPSTLRAPAACAPGVSLRILVAARIDGVRLIDNLPATCGAAR